MSYDKGLAAIVRTALVVALLLVGGYLIGLASGLVAPAEGAGRKPGWLIGIGGAVFVVAALAIAFQNRPAAGWLAAMFILACNGAVGLWIGLFADPRDIAGGLPLLSATTNAWLGRAAFGGGGLMCLALLAWGLWLGPGRQRSD